MAPLSQRSSALTNRQLQENPVSLVIVYRPVEQLRLSAGNPRLHTEKQLGQIAKSIKTFGFLVPVLVDAELRVIAGHGRVEAAKLLGMRDLPTVSVEHLTEPQITAFRIADNKLAINSQWDEKLLGEQLKALSAVELKFELETIGFEIGEIDLLIENLQPGAENDREADALPEAERGVRVTAPGDLWFFGRNRVLCGDPLDPGSYVKVMEGQKANMVFTDPPYHAPISRPGAGPGGILPENFEIADGELNTEGLTDFLDRIFNLLISQTTEGSIHFIVTDWRHMSEILIAGKRAYGLLKDLCVWAKDNAETGSLYRSQHELVFVFQNGTDRPRNNLQTGQFGRSRSNVWRYRGLKSLSRATAERNLALRSSAKPVPLVADAIMDCSAKSDVVLDPFLGSGTTVIAAERTGRICYGIEIDPNVVDTVIRRWQTFTGLSAKHASPGRSFRESEEEPRQ